MDILRIICILRDMDFEGFRREISSEVFDYQILSKYLKDLKKPRDKVSALVAEGKIVRIKKGLYVFGEKWRLSPLRLEVIANLLYGPSCVSFEYALTHYGLLAERSFTVTSLTLGDSKTFETPLGVFEYRAIDREKFKAGIEYRDLQEEGGYFIACREKALIDLIYRTPGIRTVSQLRHYLFEEMRFDENSFRNLDFFKLKSLSEIYQKKSVNLLLSL